MQQGQLRLDPKRVVAKLLDDQKITGWMIDNTGAITPQEQIDAVYLRNFCASTGHCEETAKESLEIARIALRHFLDGARDRVDPKFQLMLRPGETASSDSTTDFIEGRYVSTCAAATLPPPPAAQNPTSQPAATGPSAGPLDKFVVRDKVGNLAYATDSSEFKGVGPATIGYNSNGVSHTNTFTSSGVIGYQASRIYYADPGSYTDFIPYIGTNIKKVNSTPPPKSGNLDALSGGILTDTLFPLFIYHELKFYPQVVRNYQDRSETLSGTITYIPEPAVPVLGSVYDIGHLVFIKGQPSFNLAYEHVAAAGENETLRAIGNYTAFGPGVDVYLYGFPSSLLQKFGFNASYRFFHNTQSGLNSISNFQSSLSYYPFGQQNFSFTFKYVVGKDLSTLVSQKDYTLGIGIKF